MRGEDQQQNHVFSYLSLEERVRPDHPLRTIRAMVDEVLSGLSRRFDSMYAKVGYPSIAPEKLLRGQLLQMLYSIRKAGILGDILQECITAAKTDPRIRLRCPRLALG
jgi:transposase